MCPSFSQTVVGKKNKKNDDDLLISQMIGNKKFKKVSKKASNKN